MAWSAAVVACAVATLDFASAASAAFPGRNGRIAYGEDDCGRSRLATMRPDGTGRRFLTPPTCSGHFSSGAGARAPAWAPDGRRLVFEWTELGTFGSGLASVDAGGSHRKVVLSDPARSPDAADSVSRFAPTFAPDGRHLAYAHSASERAPDGSIIPIEIWTASIDGSQDQRLGEGSLPRWSPNGRTIAHVSQGGTWLMSARTGTRVRRIWRLKAESLDWAPDGQRLVAARSGGIFLLRADGRGAHRLPSTRHRPGSRVFDGEPVWSPDGRRIVFVRQRALPQPPSDEFGRRVEIWTISPRGTQARRLWKRDDGFDSDTETPTLSWQPLPR